MRNIKVGIDIGNTNAVVAEFNDDTGEAVLLRNSIGSYVTPCAVCIDGGITVIGENALLERNAGNESVAVFYRGFLRDEDYHISLDGEEYTAEMLTTVFLKHLIEDIERTNDVRIEAAVFTIPAHFGMIEKHAIQTAFRKAGLGAIAAVTEQIAAIKASGLEKTLEGNVLILDLGGTSLDVTVAEIKDGEARICAVSGDECLGGNDWARVIAEALAERFYDDFGVSLFDSQEGATELLDIARRKNIVITYKSDIHANVRFEGFCGRYRITREEYEARSEHLMHKVDSYVTQCFDSLGGGFGWNSISEVLLVGGAAKMPQIEGYVKEMLGRPPVKSVLPPDAVIAAGAAICADIIFGDEPKMPGGGN